MGFSPPRPAQMTFEVSATSLPETYRGGMVNVTTRPAIGPLLREWRQRRRLSQLDLGLQASVSARHLSFLETGRSNPSAEMVVHLSEQLDVPLRERNQLLLAAGYAPLYAQRDLDAPEMGPVRDALEQLLHAHNPNPAVVIDRHWGLILANDAIALLTDDVAPHLLEPPVNVLRLSLHPDGMAPRIVNLPEWRAHLLDRLGRESIISGDPALAALHQELAAYPGAGPGRSHDLASADIAVPLRIRAGEQELTFISTVTTFGTATDVTVSELSIESFFPADPTTSAHLATRTTQR
jgi:transcriptional regulator with XRE-family HTH domain